MAELENRGKLWPESSFGMVSTCRLREWFSPPGAGFPRPAQGRHRARTAFRMTTPYWQPTAQLWLSVSASVAAHAALLGGLWWAGTHQRNGPRLTLHLQSGESSAVVLVAGTVSSPQPKWESAVEIVLPEPTSTLERLSASPSTERSLPVADQEVAAMAETSVTRTAVTSTPSNTEHLPMESPPQRPERVRSRPRPASLAGSVSLVQDLGVKRPAVPSKKTTPPLVYPREAFEAGVEGRVEVLVTIDAAGRVVSSRLYRSSGHRVLDEAAVDWVKKWRFEVEKSWFVGRDEIVFRAPVRFDILPRREDSQR